LIVDTFVEKNDTVYKIFGHFGTDNRIRL